MGSKAPLTKVDLGETRPKPKPSLPPPIVSDVRMPHAEVERQEAAERRSGELQRPSPVLYQIFPHNGRDNCRCEFCGDSRREAEVLRRIAAAVAEEREACADLAERAFPNGGTVERVYPYGGSREMQNNIARDIRARGQK